MNKKTVSKMKKGSIQKKKCVTKMAAGGAAKERLGMDEVPKKKKKTNIKKK